MQKWLRKEQVTKSEKFYLRNQINEVSKLVKELKPKSSSGIDGISNKLLKATHESIKEPLTLIFNKSLKTGVFPSPWKTSKVKPLCKCKANNVITRIS